MKTSSLTIDRIKKYLESGKRFDGRALDSYREISIEVGESKNAEGSARVKLGNTEVMVGIKMDVTTPYTDHEGEGTLITTSELLPLASERFESGPPSIESIELARIVDRGIRESGFIDFKKLCIKEGEKVWGIFVDLYAINDDGNLFDAFALGAMAALLNAKLPKYNEKTEKVEYGESSGKPVPLTKILPIPTTFYKIGNKIVIDPVRDEEDSSEARITIWQSILDGKKMINAIQRGGEEGFNIEEINDIIDSAGKIFDILQKKIQKISK